MFYTRIAQVFAALMCFLGAWKVVGGFVFGATPEAMARYLGSGSAGYHIDGGLQLFLIGVALGVLTEIRISLKNNNIGEN